LGRGQVLLPGDPPGSIVRHCFPLWRVQRSRPVAGCVFLPAVRTVVYTLPGHVWRHERVRQILGACGFGDWEFFFGTKTRNYWETIGRDHAAIVRRYQAPLLVLEDDVELRAWRGNVRPAAGAEVCYLGGFRSGDRRGIVNARLRGLRPEESFRYGWLPVDDCWMRVFGMWGSHAILWLDRGAQLEAADLWCRELRMVDEMLAVNQWRWQVHCLYEPMFWQNDGHHFRDTFDYRPRPRLG
jgi:hypothetical protein